MYSLNSDNKIFCDVTLFRRIKGLKSASLMCVYLLFLYSKQPENRLSLSLLLLFLDSLNPLSGVIKLFKDVKAHYQLKECRFSGDTNPYQHPPPPDNLKCRRTFFVRQSRLWYTYPSKTYN